MAGRLKIYIDLFFPVLSKSRPRMKNQEKECDGIQSGEDGPSVETFQVSELRCRLKERLTRRVAPLR